MCFAPAQSSVNCPDKVCYPFLFNNNFIGTSSLLHFHSLLFSFIFSNLFGYHIAFSLVPYMWEKMSPSFLALIFDFCFLIFWFLDVYSCAYLLMVYTYIYFFVSSSHFRSASSMPFFGGSCESWPAVLPVDTRLAPFTTKARFYISTNLPPRVQ